MRRGTAAAFALAAAILLCVPGALAQAPSTAFDLRGWKITLPGPKEFKDLEGYSSGYFFLNPQGEMCFHLDASEKGATPNASYVRAELRNLANWNTDGMHVLSAEVRVRSSLKPDKLTVLQIHGITENGGDAPPLLRIAFQSGDLFALIKSTSENEKNAPVEKILLRKGAEESFVAVEVVVDGGSLSISVDGEEKFRRDLGFWKFLNYFKAGCYPQAVEGVADVMFRHLRVH